MSLFFFFIITLVYTCRAFFLLYHQKIFIPYIVLVTVCLSLFCDETLSPFKYITLVSDQGLAFFFFIVTLVYTCRAFCCCIIRKYLSHILFWSQFVSVCFAMKLFSFFKIHCLQMLQLFQTRIGPFFFITTLVYTCRASFLLYHQKIFI